MLREGRRSGRSLCLVVVSAVVLATAPGPAGAATRPVKVHPPTVAALSTTTAATAGGLRLTVRGSGFAHVHRVMFGGAIAHGLHVVSSHLLTVTVPRHKPGAVTVAVVTSAGRSKVVRAGRFSYVAAPAVTSLSVPQGPSSGGAVVMVRGKSFLHVKQVMFGTVPGSQVHVLSATSLSVVTPQQADAVADVRVITSYGTSAVVAADRFAFVSPVLAVTSSTPSPVERAVGYTATLTAAGGFGAYSWTAQAMPVGLTLSAAGILSGTTYLPPGSYPVGVSVVDQAGHSASAVWSVLVTRHAGVPVAWGLNTDGTVGDGTLTERPLPVAVYGLDHVVSLAAGEQSTYALKADGTVWAWGLNDLDQLGDGTQTQRLTPVQVAGLSSIVSIASLQHGGLALSASGSVYSWGWNGDGAIGDGTTMDRALPVLVPGLSGIVAIAAGRETGYAVDRNGAVYGWGYNLFGEIGDGTTSGRTSPVPLTALSGVASLTSGGDSAFALRKDGTVYAWGSSGGDFLGLGPGLPTAVVSPMQVPGLTDIVALASSRNLSDCWALRADGVVLGWGSNAQGQVGDGATTDRPTPVPLAGLGRVVELGAGTVVTDTGHVIAWGMSYATNLANGGVQATPIDVSLLRGVTGLAASGYTYYGIR